MPGVVMASPQSKTPALRYKVFTATRPGLNRDLPPGRESLMWVANSATLIHGERDAVLVDTFLTVEQSNGLADAIVASGKMLKAIYITHAHGDHFFGIKVLQDRFPSANAWATPAVVARMKLQVTPEKLNSRWRKLFPNQIPDVISIADPLEGDEIELEGSKLDDRFHEASIGGANRGGTERMLVDSSFEELNEERQHGNMAASA
jgi:glyoxylase-like metal-dependent hydrolase (beta-lactamase superfamily II)